MQEQAEIMCQYLSVAVGGGEGVARSLCPEPRLLGSQPRALPCGLMDSCCPLSRSWGFRELTGKLEWGAQPGQGGRGTGDHRDCVLTFRALLDKGSTDMFAEGALWAET